VCGMVWASSRCRSGILIRVAALEAGGVPARRALLQCVLTGLGGGLLTRLLPGAGRLPGGSELNLLAGEPLLS